MVSQDREIWTKQMGFQHQELFYGPHMYARMISRHLRICSVVEVNAQVEVGRGAYQNFECPVHHSAM